MSAVKHHYIPKCYLKAWTGADGMLCEYRRPHQSVVAKRRHPSETGWLDKLYTVRAFSAAEADLIETRFFAPVDQLAADVLDLFRRNKTDLTPAQKNGWTRFLMSLIHRHPANIERLWEMARERYHADIDAHAAEYESLKGPDDPATFEEFRLAGDDKMIGQLFAGVIRRICDSEGVGNQINGMHSHVVSLSGPRRFLTSDRPLIVTDGLQQPTATLMLPITPRKLFVATNAPAMNETLHVGLQSGAMIDLINVNVVRQAHQYVYAICENELEFVEANLKRDLPLTWRPPADVA
jgi:hypothetical protein